VVSSSLSLLPKLNKHQWLNVLSGLFFGLDYGSGERLYLALTAPSYTNAGKVLSSLFDKVNVSNVRYWSLFFVCAYIWHNHGYWLIVTKAVRFSGPNSLVRFHSLLLLSQYLFSKTLFSFPITISFQLSNPSPTSTTCHHGRKPIPQRLCACYTNNTSKFA
jgi:hypothetical protein